MVYVVVQLPDTSMQEGGLNVPPTLPSVHMTEPVVAVGELDVSLTWAENVTEPPGDTVAELGVTVVLVGLI